VIELFVEEGGRRDTRRRFDEATIEAIGDGCAGYSEPINPHAMCRALVVGSIVTAHQEVARGDRDHLRLKVCGQWFHWFQRSARARASRRYSTIS
jgi:hypothetical protein